MSGPNMSNAELPQRCSEHSWRLRRLMQVKWCRDGAGDILRAWFMFEEAECCSTHGWAVSPRLRGRACNKGPPWHCSEDTRLRGMQLIRMMIVVRGAGWEGRATQDVSLTKDDGFDEDFRHFRCLRALRARGPWHLHAFTVSRKWRKRRASLMKCFCCGQTRRESSHAERSKCENFPEHVGIHSIWLRWEFRPVSCPS